MSLLAASSALAALAAPAVSRGISIRADAQDPSKILADLQRAHATFTQKVEAELAGKADAVVKDEIVALNKTISELQGALDAHAQSVAALKLGNNPGDGLTDDERAHASAFAPFMRTGKIEARGSTFSDPDGGFLTPKTVDSMITRVLGDTVAMRRLSQVITLGLGSDTYVKNKSLGGTGSGWVGESDSRPETDTPRLSRVEVPLDECYAMPITTQRLLDDGGLVNVEEWYANEVAIELAELEGTAFVSGDGVKKPRGILSYDKVANASYAWGKTGFVVSGAASSFLTPSASVSPADALIDLVHSLKSGYRQNASFLMNDLTLGAVRKFKDADGQFIWQPSLQLGTPSTLLGYAVETDDNMPDVAANAFPIAFADFARAYLIVDRAGIRVVRDNVTSKGNVQFYSTKRVGGGVQDFGAIKLLKIST
ncbi:MAG: phage major capsid protein [Alphaproteobacteria bacterium]|nr:phage major capsid protein [Alphaproteobacteria bacterium]